MPDVERAANDAMVLGDLRPDQVRVRFPPSPTGNLHVGNVRSALFNWAFARHYGGTFILRIEDTDVGRNFPVYAGLLDALTWLGLEWDEVQSKGGHTVRTSSLSEPQSIVTWWPSCWPRAWPIAATAPGKRSKLGRPLARPGTVRLRRYCRYLDPERVRKLQAMSAPSVIRMLVPDAPIDFDDLVRGPVGFAAAHVPDYVLVRANGEPLYTLVNPVDDALMEVTHVLRGEDLLSSTPRQIVLYAALKQLAIGAGRTPIFGHLPTVLGEGNRRLSKRDKGSGLAEYREHGYLPEALLNYLALLGWAIAEDRDIFTMEEMVPAFDITRVNASPARFDPKKCEAINAAHIRRLPVDELTEQLIPFLVGAGLISEPPLPHERSRLVAATPLIQERITTLSEAVELLRFLFADDDAITIEPDAGLSIGLWVGDLRRDPSLGRARALRRHDDRSVAAKRAGVRARTEAQAGIRTGTGGHQADVSRHRCSSLWNCSAGTRRWRG